VGIDEPLTREIVRRILAAARPDRVILFGSAATGKMTRDSDIDILIVEPSPADHHEESVRIRRALGNVDWLSGRCDRDLYGAIRGDEEYFRWDRLSSPQVRKSAL